MSDSEMDIFMLESSKDNNFIRQVLSLADEVIRKPLMRVKVRV